MTNLNNLSLLEAADFKAAVVAIRTHNVRERLSLKNAHKLADADGKHIAQWVTDWLSSNPMVRLEIGQRYFMRVRINREIVLMVVSRNGTEAVEALMTPGAWTAQMVSNLFTDVGQHQLYHPMDAVYGDWLRAQSEVVMGDMSDTEQLLAHLEAGAVVQYNGWIMHVHNNRLHYTPEAIVGGQVCVCAFIPGHRPTELTYGKWVRTQFNTTDPMLAIANVMRQTKPLRSIPSSSCVRGMSDVIYAATLMTEAKAVLADLTDHRTTIRYAGYILARVGNWLAVTSTAVTGIARLMPASVDALSRFLRLTASKPFKCKPANIDKEELESNYHCRYQGKTAVKDAPDKRQGPSLMETPVSVAFCSGNRRLLDEDKLRPAQVIAAAIESGLVVQVGKLLFYWYDEKLHVSYDTEKDNIMTVTENIYGKVWHLLCAANNVRGVVSFQSIQKRAFVTMQRDVIDLHGHMEAHRAGEFIPDAVQRLQTAPVGLNVTELTVSSAYFLEQVRRAAVLGKVVRVDGLILYYYDPKNGDRPSVVMSTLHRRESAIAEVTDLAQLGRILQFWMGTKHSEPTIADLHSRCDAYFNLYSVATQQKEPTMSVDKTQARRYVQLGADLVSPNALWQNIQDAAKGGRGVIWRQYCLFIHDHQPMIGLAKHGDVEAVPFPTTYGEPVEFLYRLINTLMTYQLDAPITTMLEKLEQTPLVTDRLPRDKNNMRMKTLDNGVTDPALILEAMHLANQKDEAVHWRDFVLFYQYGRPMIATIYDEGPGDARIFPSEYGDGSALAFLQALVFTKFGYPVESKIKYILDTLHAVVRPDLRVAAQPSGKVTWGEVEQQLRVNYNGQPEANTDATRHEALRTMKVRIIIEDHFGDVTEFTHLGEGHRRVLDKAVAQFDTFVKNFGHDTPFN